LIFKRNIDINRFINNWGNYHPQLKQFFCSLLKLT
jgi:hypothetical protein